MKENAPGPSVVPAAKLNPMADGQVFSYRRRGVSSTHKQRGWAYLFAVDVHSNVAKVHKSVYILDWPRDDCCSILVQSLCVCVCQGVV